MFGVWTCRRDSICRSTVVSSANVDRLIHVFSDHRLILVDTNFLVKRDIGPPGALLRVHSAGLRLITLPSVTGGTDQLRISRSVWSTSAGSDRVLV